MKIRRGFSQDASQSETKCAKVAVRCDEGFAVEGDDFTETTELTNAIWDKSDGLYTASSAGQTFLQSVNVDSLINGFGAASKVTGVAVVGNPAYRTGEGLSTFTAISKKDGVITEHTAANSAREINDRQTLHSPAGNGWYSSRI